MSEWTLYDTDAAKGLRRWVKMDADGNTIMRREYTNVGEFVEQSKTLQNSGHDGYNEARDRRHVGHIPDWIINKIQVEEGVNILLPEGKERLLKLLMDPDYKYLVRSNNSNLSLVNGVIR